MWLRKGFYLKLPKSDTCLLSKIVSMISMNHSSHDFARKPFNGCWPLCVAVNEEKFPFFHGKKVNPLVESNDAEKTWEKDLIPRDDVLGLFRHCTLNFTIRLKQKPALRKPLKVTKLSP